jgi:hypothetical protein
VDWPDLGLIKHKRGGLKHRRGGKKHGRGGKKHGRSGMKPGLDQELRSSFPENIEIPDQGATSCSNTDAAQRQNQSAEVFHRFYWKRKHPDGYPPKDRRNGVSAISSIWTLDVQ